MAYPGRIPFGSVLIHNRCLSIRHIPIFFLLCVIFSTLPVTDAQYPFSVPLTCENTSEYFSTPNLRCLECPAHSTSFRASTWQYNPDLQKITSLSDAPSLFPSAFTSYPASSQTTPCVCDPNYYRAPTITFACLACPTNTVALSDQSACVSCDATTSTRDTVLGDCVCNTAGHVLLETDATGSILTQKKCSACPANTLLSPSNRYSCVSCPDPLMTLPAAATSLAQCACPTGYTALNGKCVPTTDLSAVTAAYSSSRWGLVTYSVAATDAKDKITSFINNNRDVALVTLTSPLIYNTFAALAVQCKRQLHMPSCHAIANYCVLNQYDGAHETCRFMQDMQASTNAINYGFLDWREGLPWLFISDSDMRTSTVLSGRVKLRGSNEVYAPAFDLTAATATASPATASAVSVSASASASASASVASASLLSSLLSSLSSFLSTTTTTTTTTAATTVGSSFHTLSYLLATYALNGTLLSVEPLATQLQLCPSNAVDSTRFLDFGTEFANDCTLDLAQLLRAPAHFHELYYVDADAKWYPVLVKPANYVSGAARPNVDAAGAEVHGDEMKLARRFFLVDNVSSLPSPSSSSSSSPSFPVIITYARRLSLRVRVRAGSVQQIYPPVLWVEYSSRRLATVLGYDPNVTPSPYVAGGNELAVLSGTDRGFGGIGGGEGGEGEGVGVHPAPSSPSPDPHTAYLYPGDHAHNLTHYTATEDYFTASKGIFTTASLSPLSTLPRSIASKAHRTSAVAFTQEYHKDIGKIETATIVLFWIFFAVVLCLWVLKMVVLRKKNGGGMLGLGDIVEYVCLLVGVVSELMFWIAFGCVAVVFFFYKAQEEVHVLLPSSDNFISKSLLPFFIAAFVMSLLYVVSLIVGQLSADLLFIDWETPVPSLHPGMQRSGVSLWRRVYATTRWIDLQTTRKHNVAASLCILLFLTKACGLEGLATAQPDGNNLSLDFPISSLLRCFVTAMFFLLAAGAQTLIAWVCYGWLWPDPTVNFADLLSNCNISLLVFDGYLHCYYLHGKHVHDSADVSLAEFRRQREQERLGWVRPRGLVHGVSLFSVYLTPELRRVYDDMFVDARNKAIVASLRDGDNAGVRGSLPAASMTGIQLGNMASGTNLPNGAFPGASSTPYTASFGMQAHHETIAAAKKAEDSLNRLWIDFLDKTSTLHKWTFTPRHAFASWLDLGGTRVASSEYSSMFCEDTRKHVESLLLYGIEYQLLVFYTIALCMFELAFNSTLVAVCVVYALDYAVVALRRKLGRVNTAKKALLEERYIL